MKVSMVFCEFRINGDQNSANKKTRNKIMSENASKVPRNIYFILGGKINLLSRRK